MINYGRLIVATAQKELIVEFRKHLRTFATDIDELEIVDGIHFKFSKKVINYYTEENGELIMRMSIPFENIEWISANVQKIDIRLASTTGVPEFFEQFVIDENIPVVTSDTRFIGAKVPFNNLVLKEPEWIEPRNEIEFDMEEIIDNEDDIMNNPVIDWNTLGEDIGTYDYVFISSMYPFSVVNVPDNFKLNDKWERNISLYIKPKRTGGDRISFMIPAKASHNEHLKQFVKVK